MQPEQSGWFSDTTNASPNGVSFGYTDKYSRANDTCSNGDQDCAISNYSTTNTDTSSAHTNTHIPCLGPYLDPPF